MISPAVLDFFLLIVTLMKFYYHRYTVYLCFIRKHSTVFFGPKFYHPAVPRLGQDCPPQDTCSQFSEKLLLQPPATPESRQDGPIFSFNHKSGAADTSESAFTWRKSKKRKIEEKVKWNFINKGLTDRHKPKGKKSPVTTEDRLNHPPELSKPQTKPMPIFTETQGMNCRGNSFQTNTIPQFPDLSSFSVCASVCAFWSN